VAHPRHPGLVLNASQVTGAADDQPAQAVRDEQQLLNGCAVARAQALQQGGQPLAVDGDAQPGVEAQVQWRVAAAPLQQLAVAAPLVGCGEAPQRLVAAEPVHQHTDLARRGRREILRCHRPRVPVERHGLLQPVVGPREVVAEPAVERADGVLHHPRPTPAPASALPRHGSESSSWYGRVAYRAGHDGQER